MDVLHRHLRAGSERLLTGRPRARCTSPRLSPPPSGAGRLDSIQRMPIKMENVGTAVRDIEAATALFTDLGLTVLGRDIVSGAWADTAVGLDGNHARIAMLQTPDGHGRVELFEYCTRPRSRPYPTS